MGSGLLFPNIDLSGETQQTLEELLLSRERNRVLPRDPYQEEQDRLTKIGNAINAASANAGTQQSVTAPSSLADTPSRFSPEGLGQAAMDIGQGVVGEFQRRTLQNPVVETGLQAITGLGSAALGGVLSIDNYLNRL